MTEPGNTRHPDEPDTDPDPDSDLLVVPFGAEGRNMPEEDQDDGPIQVSWQITRDPRTAEWSFYLFEIGARGTEDLIAEMPLDPELASEMSTALGEAYHDMSGGEVPTAGETFAGEDDGTKWWKREGWATNRGFQSIVLGVIALLVLLTFLINTLGG